MSEVDEYPRFRLTKGDPEPMRKRIAQQESRAVVKEYLENKRLLDEWEFAQALPLPEHQVEIPPMSDDELESLAATQKAREDEFEPAVDHISAEEIAGDEAHSPGSDSLRSVDLVEVERATIHCARELRNVDALTLEDLKREVASRVWVQFDLGSNAVALQKVNRAVERVYAGEL
jgi:hypothetical protein